MILKEELVDVKRFDAYQDKLGSQGLNVTSCKILWLKLSNQLLKVAIGLLLDLKICEEPRCVCGKDVTGDA